LHRAASTAPPGDGCYFERQKALSGSLDDVIANDLVDFDGCVAAPVLGGRAHTHLEMAA
jgi:hypothetical protein